MKGINKATSYELMRMLRRAVWGSLAVGLMLALFSDESYAIPTFARKYRTSCTTCHAGYNKLNSFGEAYKYNGYQIPEGDAAYVKEEPVKLGADAWKKVWPEAVWPGAIPEAVPISMMIHQRASWNESHSITEIDMDFPHEWELLVGGTLSDAISFFGEFVLYEDGNVEGTERLFLQFNDLGAGQYGWLPEDSLNLKIGHFDIAADPFPHPVKRTLTPYLSSDYTVGSSGFQLRDRQSGIEANGIIGNRFRYAAAVVNGNSSAGGDDNSAKDGYWRLEYKFGGMALDGSSNDTGGELKQTDNWAERSLSLAAVGYHGKGKISDYTNDFQRLGCAIQCKYDDLELTSAVVFGEDDNPSGTGTGVDTTAWFTELNYILYPWLIGALRYEAVDYDDTTNDVERLVPSLSAYLRANVRLTLEGRLYPEHEDGNNTVLADLSVAF